MWGVGGAQGVEKNQEKTKSAWQTSPKKQMNAKTGPGAPGDEARKVACPHAPHGGECKGKNDNGMRYRAHAGWGLMRVRPAGLAEDRVLQTASAPAGP